MDTSRHTEFVSPHYKEIPTRFSKNKLPACEMKPRVSVGICARNSEDSIASAIESIVEQDFVHELMEIIFVDDGSEDKTLNIMETYASKIDIPARIFSDKWRGLGKARNTVINNARGDYIVWLDSDEILEKNFVRKQVDLMDRNSKAGIITAKWGILGQENIILLLELIPHVVEYSRQDWQARSKLPGTGAATHRVAAVRQVGGFDESIEGAGEDIELASRIRRAGWLILRGNSTFYETHGQLFTWKDLWKRYVNQGVHCRCLHRKSNEFFSFYRMNPIASLVAAFTYAVLGYETTKLKVAFLLPSHFTFKMTAWFYGFSKG
jgi:glycosyltransferase involved in cell wall biosynthesis